MSVKLSMKNFNTWMGRKYIKRGIGAAAVDNNDATCPSKPRKDTLNIRLLIISKNKGGDVINCYS